MILLFASKSVELEDLKTLTSQQAQDTGMKDAVLEELARAAEAATVRSNELEEKLGMIYASEVEKKNRFQAVLERKWDLQEENERVDETAALAKTLPKREETRVGTPLLHSYLGATDLDGHRNILETHDPKPRNGELEKEIHELKSKVRDLEAKDIGREMELAAGRHREGKLRRENITLLDERDLLHRTIAKSIDTDMDALRKENVLILEDLKQQRAHNAKLKATQDVLRRTLVEVSTARDGSAILLEETKSTLTELKRALESSQVDFKESQMALVKLQMALNKSEVALEESTKALGKSRIELRESRVSLNSSERSLGLANVALSESTAALSNTKSALTESNSQVSHYTQHFQYATTLTERWKETCLAERQANIHFLSRLAAAGATVNHALVCANNSVLAGADAALAKREGVEPAMYRMMALVNLEINRRVGQGETSKDWVGLEKINNTKSAPPSQTF